MGKIPRNAKTITAGRRRENLRKVGALGEKIALGHLERSGFRLIRTNWTGRAAEIDLIALDTEGTFWFFEVKFRRGVSTGSASESFTEKKRHDFFRAVSLYCSKNGVDFDRIRTGLIAIDEIATGYRLARYPDLSAEG
ncbi:MAG: putative endonuclease [Patescibacteria group bacterium]|nr:putative endonuclease [Patescibacteria group bacterium]